MIDVVENLKKDLTLPYTFENVVNCYKWLEQSTNCQIVDNINNEYTYEHIFNLFVQGKSLENIIGTPISIDQYTKLLREYTKFGKLMYFPEKEVYKMVRNIVRKSIIIAKVSAMCSMFKYLPYDFVKNTLVPYYSDFIGEKVEVQDSGYTISFKTDTSKILDKYEMSKEDDLDEKNIEKKISKKWAQYCYYPLYNVKFDKRLFVVKNNIQQETFVWNRIFGKEFGPTTNYPMVRATFDGPEKISIKATTVLAAFEIGFLEFFSKIMTEQVGLAYIFYYLKQLKDDMSLEEIVVWINKMIHVYHIRGNISKYFIEGGSTNLDVL